MKTNLTIVAFGDSITEAIIGVPDEKKRWPNALKSKLEPDFPEIKVINSGVGGNSAREAMARFQSDVLAHDPDWVVLEFGGNNEDLTNPGRIVSLEEFRALLIEYQTSLPAKTKTIVVTFPPVLDDLHAYGKTPAFEAHYQKAGGIDKSVEPYREMTRAFAKENGLPIYDFHQDLIALGMANGRMTYTLDDGIHLTEEGNAILANGVFQILKDILMPSEEIGEEKP